MKQIRRHQYGISIFLAILFSTYSMGCRAYVWTRSSPEKIVQLKDKPLDIYLTDAVKLPTRVWLVTADSLNQEQLQGSIRKLTPGEKDFFRHPSGSKKDVLSSYHIILSLKKEYAQALPDTASNVKISLAQVEKIEVYEYDQDKSELRTVFAVLGTTVLVVFVLLLIALATKSSCPFIYADNPDGRIFEGEIYSGATLPQLERQDWLPMRNLKVNGNTYQLTIANKVKEIQHTNLMELVAIDHPDNMIVQYDKYGRLHTLSDLQSPVKATDLNGRDIREQIVQEDSLCFIGLPDNASKNAEDGMILQFNKPAGAKQAKLLIHAKNSLWMDYTHGLMLDEFGDYSDKVRENSLQKSPEALKTRLLEQNIPLSVWLETTPGKWERADYFNLSGPMALKRDVLLLDLPKVKGDQVRIKLSYGFMFWEIDYAALDFTADQPVQVQTLAPITAIDQTGADVLPQLLADDAAYYDQPNVGDEALVTFPAPPVQAGMQRSLILHSKGYYQILRAPTDAHPNLRYVKQFSKPNAFPVFAREKWRESLKQQHVALQTTMK